MSHGAHQDLRVLEQVVEAQVFAIPQIFGQIDNDRRQSGSETRGVRREPNGREESVSILPLSTTSQFRMELSRCLRARSAIQCWEELRDRKTRNERLAGSKETLGGLIGENDFAGGVNGHDRGRTAFYQNAQLFFGILSQLAVGFHRLHMIEGNLAFADNFGQ